MKISNKKREQLYSAIHEEIITTRIKLKLPSDQDFILAQTIDKIWKRQKQILQLSEHGE